MQAEFTREFVVEGTQEAGVFQNSCGVGSAVVSRTTDEGKVQPGLIESTIDLYGGAAGATSRWLCDRHRKKEETPGYRCPASGSPPAYLAWKRSEDGPWESVSVPSPMRPLDSEPDDQ